MACSLQVGGENLPQVEEFKYLGVLEEGLGQAAAVMQSLYRTVVVKRELSVKAKLSIFQALYSPTLTYGHELWIMTERMRSRFKIG